MFQYVLELVLSQTDGKLKKNYRSMACESLPFEIEYSSNKVDIYPFVNSSRLQTLFVFALRMMSFIGWRLMQS